MFKFMKSKKGFSLVELMIVVVIMAILVAVAVPIYNAVTANARTKTCLDNQRTIINTISNEIMLKGYTVKTGGETITITSNVDGDGGTAVAAEKDVAITQARFNALFQTVPYCPSEAADKTKPATASKIIVTITQTDGVASVTTQCTAGHQLNPGNAGDAGDEGNEGA